MFALVFQLHTLCPIVEGAGYVDFICWVVPKLSCGGVSGLGSHNERCFWATSSDETFLGALPSPPSWLPRDLSNSLESHNSPFEHETPHASPGTRGLNLQRKLRKLFSRTGIRWGQRVPKSELVELAVDVAPAACWPRVGVC